MPELPSENSQDIQDNNIFRRVLLEEISVLREGEWVSNSLAVLVHRLKNPLIPSGTYSRNLIDSREFFFNLSKTAEGRLLGQLDEDKIVIEAEYEVEIDQAIADLGIENIEESLLPRISNLRTLVNVNEGWKEFQMSPRDEHYASQQLSKELFDSYFAEPK